MTHDTDDYVLHIQWLFVPSRTIYFTKEKLEVVWPMFVLIPPITVTLEFYKPHLTEFSSVVMSSHASNICRWLH